MTLSERVFAVLEGKETYKDKTRSPLTQAAMCYSDEHGVSLDEAKKAIEDAVLDTAVDRELCEVFDQVIAQASRATKNPVVDFISAFETALLNLGVEDVHHIVTYFDLVVDESLTPVKAVYYAERVAVMVKGLQESPVYRSASPSVRRHLMTGLKFKYSM